MKHFFFFGLAVVLPIVVIGGGLLYLVWHTCYALYDDWKLNRELAEIRAASRARRAGQGSETERQPDERQPEASEAAETTTPQAADDNA